MQIGWRKNYLRYNDYFLDVLSAYKEKPEMLMFLEIILTLSTSAILLIFALRPTILTITSLYKEIESKEKVVEELNKKMIDLDKAKNVSNREQKRIALLDMAIPKNPEPDQFALQLQGSAYIDSVVLKNMSIDEVTLIGDDTVVRQKANLAPLPENAKGFSFTFRTEGSFSPINNFITHLESMRRPVKTDVINIFNPEPEDINDNLNLIVTGQLPYFR